LTSLTLLASPAAFAQIAPVDRSGLEGLVAGRVCRDVDGDGACGADEPGVGGVRLVLASGQEVRTDADGRYAVPALESRIPSLDRGGRWLRGRHRLRVDARSLPAGLLPAREAVTFEVPMAGLVLVDFPLGESVSVQAVPLARIAEPPAIGWSDEGLTWELSGVVELGARVRVEGASVEVDGDGHFRIPVPVREGQNAFTLSVERPGGEVGLYSQRVEVISREGQLLFVPAEPERVGRVLLPGTRDQVSVGEVALRLELPAGTRVQHGALQVISDSQGRATLPVELGLGTRHFTLSIQFPDGTRRVERLVMEGVLRPFAVGLLELEAGWDARQRRLQLEGRGQAHAELAWGAWRLAGELALDDDDARAVRDTGALTLLRPRRPERFERALDPDRTPFLPGRDAAVLSPNPAEGRLRFLLQHQTLGALGFGTHRFQLDGAEIGRAYRPMFGPFAEVSVPAGESVGVTASAGADLGLADPVLGLRTRRVHEELRATGGSVYFLREPGVSEGSERVRVVLRDGISGLPLAEHHLVRGRDYDLDARAGRILLARPLSILAPRTGLHTLPLTGEPESVLVVDYAVLALGAAPDVALGGELGAELHGASFGVGGLLGDDAYRLLRARAHVPVGSLGLTLEAAHSEGSAFAPGDFRLSDDGGLTSRARAVTPGARGDALTARLKGETFGTGGHLDASFRVRTPGFSDDAHADTLRFRQASARIDQPVGPLRLSLLADDREGQVVGGVYAGLPYAGRSLGAGLGWVDGVWALRADVRDELLSVDAAEGGRTAVGAAARLRVHPQLSLLATHRQVLGTRGAGPGALDDTHSSVGADVELEPGTRAGIRAGYGARLGPLVWIEGARAEGRDTFYSSVSTDVDGPDVGTLRSVSGARTEIGDGSSVFVEDVAAHDALTVRASRAVGAFQRLGGGFDAFVRFEQGVRDPIGAASPLTRSAGSVGVSYVGARARFAARVELWGEGGLHEALSGSERRQALVSIAGESDLAPSWTVAGRLHASDSTLDDVRAGRFVEGHVALAWHPGPWLVAARYAVEYAQPPPQRLVTLPRALQVISLLPAMTWGDRFGLAAGVHLGLSSAGGTQVAILSGAMRPSVRVVGDLELAAEVATRSVARDDEGLWALRGELAWRLGERGRLALGYTAIGFSGRGLTEDEARADRAYLRGELAW